MFFQQRRQNLVLRRNKELFEKIQLMKQNAFLTSMMNLSGNGSARGSKFGRMSNPQYNMRPSATIPPPFKNHARLLNSKDSESSEDKMENDPEKGPSLQQNEVIISDDEEPY